MTRGQEGDGDGNFKDRERSKRQKRKTLRAQELLAAGEAIPGIAASPPPSTPVANGSGPTPPSANHAVPVRKVKVTHTSVTARSRRRPDSNHFQTPSNTAPLSNQLAAGAARGRVPGVPACLAMPAQDDLLIPTFTPEHFAIYDWPRPRPGNFTKLTSELKAWKARIDGVEHPRDLDDGADNWYEFCGNRNSYPSNHRGGFALQYAIASTFKIHAMRALRAGKSWQQFSFEERNLDSEALVKTETDRRRRRMLMDEALDNTLRLCVFDALKRRLCEEIWLEEYQGPRGMVALNAAVADRQISSAVTNSRQRFPEPTQEQGRAEPTTAQSARGIAYWSIDPFGRHQPVYKEEAVIPSGITNFMMEMREQERDETSAVIESTRTGALMNDKAHGGRDAEPVAEDQVFQRELDFSDSDIDDEQNRDVPSTG